MKKLGAVGLVFLLLLTTACQNSLYRDDTVYMVNRDRANKEELVNVITADGPKPFRADALKNINPGAGESPLYIDRKAGLMWIFRPDSAPFGWEKISILAPPCAWGTVFAEDLKTGARSVLAANVPAPERVRLDAPADRLYWLADGQLYIGDLRRQTVEGPAVVNAQSRLVDMFISPTESRKLYLCPLGQADFGYYPDTGRSVPLYEMQERFYDTAPLSKQYFYANQWRQDEEGDAKGLWTVIADTRREVARVLARGSYADAYKTGVLLLGDQRFGLTLVPDFNAPEKSVRITDQYVYQTGFFAKGGIYWIGDNGLQQNAAPGRPAYLLHILSPEGDEIKRLPLSGAAILVRVTGKSAVCAGPAAESIDFANAEITDERSWQSRWLSAPLGLEETVSNTVRAFGNSLLGDKSALAELQRMAITEEAAQGITANADVTSDLSTNRHVEGHLRNALLSQDTGLAEGILCVEATDEDGHSELRRVSIRYQLFAGEWRIVQFSSAE